MNFLGASKVNADYVSLENLLKEADFVILTCSASSENKGMICKDTLSMMKANAILINVSR